MLENAGSWVTCIIVALVAIAAIGTAVLPLRGYLRRRRADAELFAVLDAAVDQHAPTLARMRARTMRRDAYGNWMTARWRNDVQAFVKREVISKRPWLSKTYAMRSEKVFRRIDGGFKEAGRPDRIANRRPDPMQPLEFGRLCVAELEAAGWHAQLTKERGDGADILAQLNGERLIVHCRLSDRAVEENAVEEIFAARRDDNAAFAAIISNADYAQAARRLAEDNDIALLHFTDLEGALRIEEPRASG